MGLIGHKRVLKIVDCYFETFSRSTSFTWFLNNVWNAGEKHFGLPAGKTMFATIRDLGEVADVRVQFDPLFMEINQGGTEIDSAFLKRRRVIFRQEEAILAQVEREIEKL